MKKLKHNKIKNTGILFELLTSQITSDILNNRKSPALDILKSYFKKNTNLNKELSLYQTLLKEKYFDETKANRLIDEVVKLNTEINKSSLKHEKYNLIKEIKSNYDLDSFFKNKINNYKIYASIYKLLENNNFTFSPSEIITSRFTIVEFITDKPRDGKTERSTLIEEYSKQDADIRNLAYQILLERFNDKYQGLGKREKTLLREYINNISDTPRLKLYINSELNKIQTTINKNTKKLQDSTIKIKLHEVNNMITDIIKKKRVDESILLTILHIYKLDDEIKKVIKLN